MDHFGKFAQACDFSQGDCSLGLQCDHEVEIGQANIEQAKRGYSLSRHILLVDWTVICTERKGKLTPGRTPAEEATTNIVALTSRGKGVRMAFQGNLCQNKIRK